ncbi:MAG: IPT/TIG domain-containing protein [Cyanobacteriota/Melainabacteria group bacterium]
MTLTFHNGFSDKPGFNWLRIFLCGDIDTSSFGKYEEPQGDLIVDENYVQQHTLSVDITDLVDPGVNTIYIEAQGPKGAVLSWTLNGVVSPQLSALNPTETHQGARLTLVGQGFSHDEGENDVYVGDLKADVIESTRSRLTIKVPVNAEPGKSTLKIVTRGVPSAILPLLIKATPRLKSINRGEDGKTAIITGVNLDGESDKTEVYFGNYRARVISQNDGSITVALPENMLASGEESFSVTVLVDGITAGGSISFD